MLLNLVRPSLLSDEITLLHNAGASDGAGGYTDAWQSVGTVMGRLYTTSDRRMESKAAERPLDLDIVRFALDVSSTAVDGSYRLRTPDGDTFEIVGLQVQPPVAFVRARRV